jgi:hypothetical protein
LWKLSKIHLHLSILFSVVKSLKMFFIFILLKFTLRVQLCFPLSRTLNYRAIALIHSIDLLHSLLTELVANPRPLELVLSLSSSLEIIISLTHESRTLASIDWLTEPQIQIPFTESQIPIPNCRIKARWILKSVKHYTNWSSLSVTNRSALSFPLPPTETQTGTDSILKIVFLVWSSADLFINLCL